MNTTLTIVFAALLLQTASSTANGAIRSISSSSNIENPLSHLLVSSVNLRQQLKERATNQLPSLQAHHQRNLHDLVRQVHRRVQEVQQRHLQTTNATTNVTTPTFAPAEATTPPPAPTVCNATTGLVNFDDDGINFYTLGAAPDVYATSCVCDEEDNTMEVSTKISQLDFLNETAVVEGFNTLIGEILVYWNYTCVNQCSACFDSLDTSTLTPTQLCGLFSTEDSFYLQNKKGNFTYEEILSFDDADSNTRASIVDKAEFYTSNCIQYTGDAYGNSEICIIGSSMGLSDENEPLYCNITYNDVLCTSCIIPAVTTNTNGTSNGTSTNDDCLIADCTNVDATYGTMINVCQNTSLTGPFQYFTLEDIANGTTFTPGACDGDDAPVATTAPVAVTSPSSTATTDMPTASPVRMSGPTPSNDNTTTTTKAPVRAPAATPLLPAPTTSGATTGTTVSLSALVGLLTFAMIRSTVN